MAIKRIAKNNGAPASLALSRANTAVLLGDSMTYKSVPTPASGYVDVWQWSIHCWLNFLLRGALHYVNYAGITNETSTDMLKRFQADVLAYDPAFCFLMTGTNDVGSGMSIDTYKANIKRMVDLARRENIFMVINCPTAGIQFYNAAGSAWFARASDFIRNLGVAYDNVIAVPTDTIWNDTSLAYVKPLVAYSPDYTHQGNLGALRVAEVMAAAISPFIKAAEPPWTHFNDTALGSDASMCINPFMIGTAGTNGTGSSGNVATGWTASVAGGGTVVCSKVARSDYDQGEWQQLAYTNDASYTAGTDKVNLSYTNYAPFPSDITAGDYIQYFIEFEMDAAPSGLRGIDAQLYFQGQPGERCLTFAGPSISDVWNANLNRQIPAGVIASAPRLVPSGATGVHLDMSVYAGGASVGATVRFGRVAIRKLDNAYKAIPNIHL